MLNAVLVFLQSKGHRGHCRMSEKYYCVIEVIVPRLSERWQNLVNDEMRYAIEKLKLVVEKLGGKVCVRY